MEWEKGQLWKSFESCQVLHGSKEFSEEVPEAELCKMQLRVGIMLGPEMTSSESRNVTG